MRFCWEGGAVQQLRIYEVPTENIGPFHERFRDDAMRIMARYDFHILGIWQSAFEGKTEFVYLLTWSDEEIMKKQWDAFLADEEWKAIKKKRRRSTEITSIRLRRARCT